MPQISMLASSAGTKGLLEGDKPLEKDGTTLQVYDYLSGDGISINGKGEGYYIDNTLTFKGSTDGSSSDGKWQFPENRKYYWTKTGIHKFFGWLTADGTPGTTPLVYSGETEWDAAEQILSVKTFEMTPSKPQFDFSYSRIISRDASQAAQRVPVPMKLDHLFTALKVDIKTNETQAPQTITVSKVSIKGLKNKKSATISFAGDGNLDPENAAAKAAVSYTNEGSVPFDVTTGWTLTSTAQDVFDYTLFWPQLPAKDAAAADIDDNTVIELEYTIKEGNNTIATKTASAKISSAGITQMDPGKKYKISLTLTYNALLINVEVVPWVEENPLIYTLKMTTNMRLFDSWLYRYDTTDQDYTNWTNWAGSHMAVSSGRVETPVAPETVPGRPLRSPQIQLVTTSNSATETFELRVDNSDFEIVRANKTNGVVTSYETSTGGVLTIQPGTTENPEVYTYFYIVPKEGSTPANPVAKVSLIYNDAVTGPQKVTFNYNVLPGYSDDSSEIWAYYVAPDDYKIDGMLKMYYQDNAHPLVPTPVQN